MSKKILLVGNLPRRVTMQNILRRSDFHVRFAATNNEAYDIHSTEKMDLIITMLDILGMETKEFFLRVRWNQELLHTSGLQRRPGRDRAVPEHEGQRLHDHAL